MFAPIPFSAVNKVVNQYEGDKYRKTHSVLEFIRLVSLSLLTEASSLRETLYQVHVNPKMGSLVNPQDKPISRSQAYKINNSLDPKMLGDIFNKIYKSIQLKYNIKRDNVYAIDSTFIVSRSKTCSIVTKGYNPTRAKRRTGVKAHLIMDITHRLPTRIAISSGNRADATTLHMLNALGKETVRVFDKGYRQYKTFVKYIEANEWFVTPRVSRSQPDVIKEFDLSQKDRDSDVIADQLCHLGSNKNNRGYHKYQIRCITIFHADNSDPRHHVLMTNMMDISAAEVVDIYAQRNMIEVDIHHLKQLLGISKLKSYSEQGILNQWILALICYLLIWIFERTYYKDLGFWKTAKFIRYNLTETWYSIKLLAPT